MTTLLPSAQKHVYDCHECERPFFFLSGFAQSGPAWCPECEADRQRYAAMTRDEYEAEMEKLQSLEKTFTPVPGALPDAGYVSPPRPS